MNVSVLLYVPVRSASLAPIACRKPSVTVSLDTGPVSNSTSTIEFKQTIGGNEPLRTGSYSKTLTFTLSTTAP